MERGKSDSNPIGYIDISAEKGKNIIAKKYIYPADFEGENIYNIVSLGFDLPKEVKEMEFRVYSLGEGAFMVDNIEVGISL